MLPTSLKLKQEKKQRNKERKISPWVDGAYGTEENWNWQVAARGNLGQLADWWLVDGLNI